MDGGHGRLEIKLPIKNLSTVPVALWGALTAGNQPRECRDLECSDEWNIKRAGWMSTEQIFKKVQLSGFMDVRNDPILPGI
jgi:hypothetical protein